MTDFELKTLIAMLFTKKKDFKEHLKVYESYVGKKFLESYETQSVYTSVFWVHEVDGQEVETYLSTSELESWECETLEPYYYTDGNRQYVGYYQTPTSDGFGQHDMKITYKSPDTGNILAVEYPIYYLQEIDLINNLTEPFDWYPFRHPFGLGESALPYNSFSLYYNCYDKKGNLIEEYANINPTPENLTFEFPSVSNGQFKFEENQEFGIAYVSEALKIYTTTMNVNVRPYYDERNTSKQFDNIETEVLVNQVEPFKIGIDLNTEEHLYYDNDSTIYKALDYPEFQMPNYISSTSRYQGSNANLGSSSSFGYIYWGDGTFSRYCAGQKFISNISVSNSSSSVNPLDWKDVKWRNGYYLSNGSRLTNFENNMFENYHRYEDFGEYSIEITNGMYRGVGNLDPSSHNEALMVFGGTDDNYRLFSGKNQHNSDYTTLAGDNMYSWHIASIDFGKSAMYWWYRYTSSGTNQYTHTARTSRGTLAYPETVEEKILVYENCFQFLFGLKSIRFSNKSCVLRGYTDLTHIAQESAFNYCPNLTDIYIEESKTQAGFEDVESISRLEFSNHISGMFELNCDNITTLHFTNGDITIQD